MQGQPPASDEDRLGRRGGTVTERERKKRAAVKKELQKKGVLPPNRPRVNRRKFAEEVMRDYQTFNGYDDDIWIREAIGMMVSDDMKRVSDEEMGVLRMLKLAAGTKKFHERLRAEGREKYSMREFYNEVYAPIMGLEAEENGLPDDR